MLRCKRTIKIWMSNVYTDKIGFVCSSWDLVEIHMQTLSQVECLFLSLVHTGLLVATKLFLICYHRLHQHVDSNIIRMFEWINALQVNFKCWFRCWRQLSNILCIYSFVFESNNSFFGKSKETKRNHLLTHTHFAMTYNKDNVLFYCKALWCFAFSRWRFIHWPLVLFYLRMVCQILSSKSVTYNAIINSYVTIKLNRHSRFL